MTPKSGFWEIKFKHEVCFSDECSAQKAFYFISLECRTVKGTKIDITTKNNIWIHFRVSSHLKLLFFENKQIIYYLKFKQILIVGFVKCTVGCLC